LPLSGWATNRTDEQEEGWERKIMLSSFLSSSHSLPISIQNGSLIHCSLHRGNYITFHNTTPSLQAKVDKVFLSFGVM